MNMTTKYTKPMQYEVKMLIPGDRIATDMGWITIIQAHTNPATQIRTFIGHDRVRRHYPVRYAASATGASFATTLCGMRLSMFS